MILDKGVDVKTRDKKFGNTPLSHFWMHSEQEKFLDLLLDYGADINAR